LLLLYSLLLQTLLQLLGELSVLVVPILEVLQGSYFRFDYPQNGIPCKSASSSSGRSNSKINAIALSPTGNPPVTIFPSDFKLLRASCPGKTVASTSRQTAEEAAEDQGQRSPWLRDIASHHPPFTCLP
jgi:hypothetical protein